MEKQLQKGNWLIIVLDIILFFGWVVGKRVSLPYFIICAMLAFVMTLALTIRAYRLLKQKGIAYRWPSYQKWMIGVTFLVTLVLSVLDGQNPAQFCSTFFMFLTGVVLQVYPNREGYKQAISSEIR
ncbi:hypothetical protein ABQH43_08725 [Streptococcus sp. ZJ100]|uniref:hypothetical protein n=1 Tax=Streptococcus handemini TaxID=3161188 RepID=UPI0032EE69DE